MVENRLKLLNLMHASIFMKNSQAAEFIRKPLSLRVLRLQYLALQIMNLQLN